VIKIAEPSIELDGHDEKAAVATYDIPFINAGTVDSTKTLRWGGADSADGAITAVQRAASGDKWADDLWDDDSDGADAQMMDENTGPDEVSGSQCYHLFKFSSNAVSFASAPILTCYDSAADRATPDEEALVGSSGHTSTFVKIVGATTSGQPAQYWGEASSANLHALETAGSVTLGAAAQGLNGDVAYMTCTSSDVNTNPQYFSLALSVPDDAALGTDIIDIVFTIKYTYT
jgi:hypothetical protein